LVSLLFFVFTKVDTAMATDTLSHCLMRSLNRTIMGLKIRNNSIGFEIVKKKNRYITQKCYQIFLHCL